MKQPLNEQFIRMQKLAGIITESKYREDIQETTLSPEEQKIADDIINTLNEGVFDDVLEKIKSYAKKGLMTAAILSSLLASPGFSQDQK
jgi:DNA-directed RNA polymerase specialized sigma54-like protein